MKTYVQDGKQITVTAPANVSAGQGVIIGSLFGVAIDDAESGKPVVIVTEGVVEIAKTSALAISVGDRLFWDNINKVVNKTEANQVCVGVAVSAAANPSSTVLMKLGGVPAVATGG